MPLSGIKILGDKMNTFEAITTRYACRSFSDEQITDEELEKIIKAANAAPAASGDYSGLKITIVQNKELCKAIDAEAAANFPFPIPHPIYGAPTLVFISSTPNEHSEGIPFANASCIAQNMMIEANALGVDSLYAMGVPRFIQGNEEIMEKLNLPEGHTPLVVVCLGHDKDEVQVVKEDRLAYEIIK